MVWELWGCLSNSWKQWENRWRENTKGFVWFISTLSLSHKRDVPLWVRALAFCILCKMSVFILPQTSSADPSGFIRRVTKRKMLYGEFCLAHKWRSVQHAWASQSWNVISIIFKSLYSSSIIHPQNQLTTMNVPKKENSQIEGPSFCNSYGFKVSMQNLQEAKALHEVGLIVTDFSSELLFKENLETTRSLVNVKWRKSTLTSACVLKYS